MQAQPVRRTWLDKLWRLWLWLVGIVTILYMVGRLAQGYPFLFVLESAALGIVIWLAIGAVIVGLLHGLRWLYRKAAGKSDGARDAGL